MFEKITKSSFFMELSTYGELYIVGGAVRDAFLGFDPKDIDIEVYGLSEADIISILKKHGKVDTVGKSFGVIKFKNELGEFDIALPRKEIKTGIGHKGFEVVPDPKMLPSEASLRRDFTINAIMYGKDGVVDFHNGLKDLESRTLRHVSDKFKEDPLRVLRGFQFCGRFGLTATKETLDMCQSLKGEYSTLSADRVFGEWNKWATKSIAPSKGLEFLKDSGWIEFYPELNNLIGIKQNPTHHGEGDVWEHTKMVCDHAHGFVGMFAALLHDIGKATNTQYGEKITSYGHPLGGVKLVDSFCESIYMPIQKYKVEKEKIKKLVGSHMDHLGYNKITFKLIKRLSDKLQPATIDELCELINADCLGRIPVSNNRIEEIREKAIEIGLFNGPPTKIITGKLLLSFGFKPGKQIGDLIERAYEAQLQEQIFDLQSAKRWIAKQKEKR